MTVRRAVVYAVLLAAAASLRLFTHSERAQIKRVFADHGGEVVDYGNVEWVVHSAGGDEIARWEIA